MIKVFYFYSIQNQKIVPDYTILGIGIMKVI